MRRLPPPVPPAVFPPLLDIFERINALLKLLFVELKESGHPVPLFRRGRGGVHFVRRAPVRGLAAAARIKPAQRRKDQRAKQEHN